MMMRKLGIRKNLLESEMYQVFYKSAGPCWIIRKKGLRRSVEFNDVERDFTCNDLFVTATDQKALTKKKGLKQNDQGERD